MRATAKKIMAGTLSEDKNSKTFIGLSRSRSPFPDPTQLPL